MDTQDVNSKINRVQIFLYCFIATLIIAASLIVYFKFFKKEKIVEEKHKEVAKTDEEKAIEKKSSKLFYDLPDFIVNLSSSGTKKEYLKAAISIAYKEESDSIILESKIPAIKEAIQFYLRQLRSYDISSSSGMIKIKSDLLVRVKNVVGKDCNVTNVFIKEIIIN